MWSTSELRLPSSRWMLRSTGICLRSAIVLIYTADLADLAAKNGVMLYAFADDTQLYIHCEFHNMATSTEMLECCIQDIGHWMSVNCLKIKRGQNRTVMDWNKTASVDSLTADHGWCSVPKWLILRVLHASSEWHSRQTCVKSTHPSSVEGVFSSYVSCDVHDVHSTRKQHRRSYIRWSPAGLTIATI